MYELEPVSVTMPFVDPPSTIRSEFAFAPVMLPLTVIPPAPPRSLRMLPFFVMIPERVSMELVPLTMIPEEPVATVTALARLLSAPPM